MIVVPDEGCDLTDDEDFDDFLVRIVLRNVVKYQTRNVLLYLALSKVIH